MAEENQQFAQDQAGNTYVWKDGQWRLHDETPGVLQSVAIGAGETFTSTARGIGDLGDKFIEGLDPGARTGVDARQRIAERDARQASDLQAFGELQAERPIATGIGQALPYVAAAPLAGNSVAGQALLEGTLGGLRYGDTRERLINATIGAGVGGGGTAMANRVARMIRGSSREIAGRGGADISAGASQGVRGSTAGAQQVEGAVVGSPRDSVARRVFNIAGQPVEGAGAQSEAGRQALRDGVELGIKFEPGMESGNVLSRQLFAGAKRASLFSDIVQTEITEANKQIYTKLALKALGETGDEITPAMINRVYTRIDDQFDQMTKKYPTLQLDDETRGLFERLADGLQTDLRSTATSDPEAKRLAKLLELTQGQTQIPTKQFIKWRSAYRNAQRKAAREGDTNAEEITSEVVDVMHKWLSKNTSEADSKKFFKTIQQYRLLKSIDRPGALTNDFKLQPGRIGGELRKNFRAEFWQNDRYGSLSEYPDVEKFFKATRVFNTFPEIAGDSGTPTGNLLQNILGDRVNAGTQFALRPLVRQIIRASQPTAESVQ